ncbi:MAG TPA: HAD family hydrolase [Bryobacteraceae bacterium]
MELRQSPPDVIVFDVDGVLVEVTASYREAIRETVRHFTGKLVSHDTIQNFKNAGGWNNDWLLSQRLIEDLGKKVDYGDVVDQFNRVFLGENGGGLIRNEVWMPHDGLLERLAARSALAIFTGRAQYELDATLERYASDIRFYPVITDERVRNPKPAPDGLLMIKREFPERTIWYLGDTVDDARSARAAQVPFIGVAGSGNPRHEEIAASLYDLGAFAVLGDVNELETLISSTGSLSSCGG